MFPLVDVLLSHIALYTTNEMVLLFDIVLTELLDVFLTEPRRMAIVAADHQTRPRYHFCACNSAAVGHVFGVASSV